MQAVIDAAVDGHRTLGHPTRAGGARQPSARTDPPGGRSNSGRHRTLGHPMILVPASHFATLALERVGRMHEGMRSSGATSTEASSSVEINPKTGSNVLEPIRYGLDSSVPGSHPAMRLLGSFIFRNFQWNQSMKCRGLV